MADLHPGSHVTPTPAEAAGIDEPMIRRLVHAFYGEARRDPVLGPIFEDAVAGAWDEHLAKLCDFWSSVLLMSGRFTGAPMAAHVRRSDIEDAHFERWLAMFRAAARDTCPLDAAELFIAKAEMIGQSLRYGLAAARGQLPSPRPYVGSGGDTG